MFEIINGDCRDVLSAMDENSIDSVVCDPPYHLTTSKNGKTGFLGKEWDGGDVAFDPETWKSVLRVLKPGGHLLAFGAPRTYHRLAVAIEDAGFEIRDCVAYNYSSGFPKSHSVALSIDKSLGHGNRGKGIPTASTHLPSGKYKEEKLVSNPVGEYEPKTEEAKPWNGWGNNLKPAFEPIILARKPLIGTIAKTVLTHGTGALNIDGTRIEHASDADRKQSEAKNRHTSYKNPNSNKDAYSGDFPPRTDYKAEKGRWPANVIYSHDENCVEVGTKTVKARVINRFTDGAKPFGNGAGHPYKSFVIGDGTEEVTTWACVPECAVRALEEQGKGAGRFFFTPKASKKEKWGAVTCGCVGYVDVQPALKEKDTKNDTCQVCGQSFRMELHSTQKPLQLLRYLVKLVTPPNGVVLDCFAGTATTGVAALQEGFNFIGIEKEETYARIAQKRLEVEGVTTLTQEMADGEASLQGTDDSMSKVRPNGNASHASRS